MTHATIEQLTGPATFAKPGASPDTPVELYGAELSKTLKKHLRMAFPSVAFSVTESRGTAIGWFRVKWTDGPTGGEVAAITGHYESSRFDGMTDGYEPTGNRAFRLPLSPTWVKGHSRGINLYRTTSPMFEKLVLAQLLKKYPNDPAPTGEFHDGAWWNQTPMANGMDANHYWSWQGIMGRALAASSYAPHDGRLTFAEGNY